MNTCIIKNKKIKKNVSCEIEDFIEAHLCKLRGILTSIARTTGLMWPHQECYLVVLIEGDKIDQIWQLWNSVYVRVNMRLWICMRPYLNCTLFGECTRIIYQVHIVLLILLMKHGKSLWIRMTVVLVVECCTHLLRYQPPLHCNVGDQTSSNKVTSTRGLVCY